METKDQLVSHIKEWLSIDEEIKLLKKEIKTRQERKKFNERFSRSYEI